MTQHTSNSKFTLYDIFSYIRTKFFQARETQDINQLKYLSAAMGVLNDIALEKNNKNMIVLTEDFADSINNTIMGADNKVLFLLKKN